MNFLHIAATIAAALFALPAMAQAPKLPDVVRIVVPYAAGNPLDSNARMLADQMGKALQRNVIVDNRPGAGGMIGATVVARAKPDGSMLLYTTSSHTTNAALYKNPPYDAIKDFTPIAQFSTSPGFVLLVGPKSQYKTVQELVQAAREKPGALSYASSGIGTTTHIVAALFARSAKIDLIHVPYKVSSVPDLISGQVNVSFYSASLGRPLVQKGNARVLAITGDTRMKEFPDVPTFAELGFGDVDVGAWSGLMGPAGMPPAMVEAFRTALKTSIEQPEYVKFNEATGMNTLSVTTPAQFTNIMETEITRYRKDLKPLGISLD